MSIDNTRGGESAFDGAFGNLVENDPLGVGRQVERLGEVPGNCLALAVLIGGKPDSASRFDELSELGDAFLLVGRDLICGGKIMFDIDGHAAFGQVTNVSKRCLDDIVTAQKLFNSLGLGGTLNDNEVFAHELEHSTLVALFV